MSSRPLITCLIVALCWTEAGVHMTEAGPFFRSPSRGTSTSRSNSRSNQQQEAESNQPASPFDGVDAPPGAPTVSGLPRQQLRIGAVSTRPSDTILLVDAAIDRTKRRYLTIGEHTPWQIFHGVLALRHEFQVRQGNHMLRGLDWLRNGVIHSGMPLVEKTEFGGRCHPYTEPWAFEGHINQFLAILSLASLPEEYQFRTPKGEIVSMGDMVNHAKMTMTGEGEMTWTLWFLSHYLDAEEEWENADGQYWSMERLVKMEARQKVNGAPCGGTHRLFALSLARNAYLAKHGNCRGAWLEADQRVREYVATARSLQNRDGSLSADWFKGRKYSNDLTTRLKTSGHQLEWLMVALPDDQLEARWVQMAVQSVANDVIRSANEPTECGALYHALDALTFYKMRKSPGPAVEKSPTYLVPPKQETPSKPSTEIASAKPATEPKADVPASTATKPKDASPELEVPMVEVNQLPIAKADPPAATMPAKPIDPNAPAAFVAPDTAQPIKPLGPPKQTASAADVLQPLGGDREKPNTKDAVDRPIEPSLAKDTLVVEEVKPGDMTPNDGTPVEASLLEGDDHLKPIPLDAEPMKAILPEKPDSESAPHVVDDENPTENEPVEKLVVEPVPAMNTANEQPVATDASKTTKEDVEILVEVLEKPLPAPGAMDDKPLRAPTLPAPSVEQAPSTEPSKVAEEPEGKTARFPQRVQQGGLVVIDLDLLSRRPILVPMAAESPIRKVSTLPW